MRILVIGGTGLISTAITRQSLEREDSVVLFNRGQTESRVPLAGGFPRLQTARRVKQREAP